MDLSTPGMRRDTIDIALVVPHSGSAGIYGPSCEACAELAISDLNVTEGLLGRQVRLIPVDGSRAPEVVAAEVGRLVAHGMVDAVTGWHISPVRQALAKVTAGRIPTCTGRSTKAASAHRGCSSPGRRRRASSCPPWTG